MDDPETWRWIWLTAAVVLALGEIATSGFYLLPFAVGALAAAALAFVGAALVWQVAVFAAASALAFVALRPLAGRVDRSVGDHGVGSRRLVNQEAMVIEDISTTGVGMVQFADEQWRAQSIDGSTIPVGTTVIIRKVEGTRALVELRSDDGPPLSSTPSEET